MSKIRFIIYFYFIISLGYVIQSVTISGVSSGAFMAVQFHVAFSSHVTGVGVLAGGPYYCSSLNIIAACANQPELIIIKELVAATQLAFKLKVIDDPANLQNSSVWLLSGKLDIVVTQGVVRKTEEYYLNFVPEKNIKSIYDIPSAHAVVTDKYGNKCSHLGTPFINNCNFDGFGDLLQHLYGPLNPPTSFKSSNIIKIDQAQYIPGYPIIKPSTISLNDYAYGYFPTYCTQNPRKCRVHVALHGCLQTVHNINDTYVTQTGFNEWAESNNIIILYPQVAANILNPMGCWDWWGYTGLDYATKLGLQMATLNNMVKAYDP